MSERGARILAGLTIVFIGVLAALTYAAVQVFDGWHHAIVIADIGIVLAAVAVWIQSTRGPAEAESRDQLHPAGHAPDEEELADPAGPPRGRPD